MMPERQASTLRSFSSNSQQPLQNQVQANTSRHNNGQVSASTPQANTKTNALKNSKIARNEGVRVQRGLSSLSSSSKGNDESTLGESTTIPTSEGTATSTPKTSAPSNWKILAIGGAGASGKLLSYQLGWSKHAPSISLIGKKDTKGSQITQRLVGRKIKETADHGVPHHEFHTVDIHKDTDELRQYIRESDIVLHLVAPYNSTRIAEICLEEGVNYVDMATNSDYTKQFADKFDAEAKRKGIVMVCGASISPGLTSCVLDKYASEFDELEHVDVHFTQGNQSIRGRNSLEVSFSRAGERVRFLQDGQVREARVGEDMTQVAFPGFPRKRLLSLHTQPEVELLTKKFPSLRSLKFHSGFELSILQYLTYFMSQLTKWNIVTDWDKYSRGVTSFARMFRWMGSNEGAFQVIMRGTKRGSSTAQHSEDSNSIQPRKRQEHRVSSSIVALNGHDTQLPITPPYIVTEKIMHGNLKPGAYPCVGLFSLDEVLQSVKTYDVHEIRDGVGTFEGNAAPLLAQAIGSNYWVSVPDSIKRFYSVNGGFASGMVTVQRSKSVIANKIADFLYLPQASDTTRLSMESLNYVFRRYFVEEGSLHLKYTQPFASSLFKRDDQDGLIREDYGYFEYGFRFKRVPAENGQYGFEYTTLNAKLGNLPWFLWLTVRPSGKVIPVSSPDFKGQRWYIEQSWRNPLFAKPLVKYQGLVELRSHCIGIDLGGCISTTFLESEDYNSNAFLRAPPVPGSFEAIQTIVDRYGAENVYIISQASFPVALRKSEWLGAKNFFEKTGTHRENVIFLESSMQKTEACRLNHIRQFVDNRLNILERLRTQIPEMHEMIWLQVLPAEDELTENVDLSSKVIVSKSWKEALEHLKP